MTGMFKKYILCAEYLHSHAAPPPHDFPSRLHFVPVVLISALGGYFGVGAYFSEASIGGGAYIGRKHISANTVCYVVHIFQSRANGLKMSWCVHRADDAFCIHLNFMQREQIAYKTHFIRKKLEKKKMLLDIKFQLNCLSKTVEIESINSANFSHHQFKVVRVLTQRSVYVIYLPTWMHLVPMLTLIPCYLMNFSRYIFSECSL